MKVFTKTDVGMTRTMNQDSYSISNEENYKLYILADGMGGYKGGEIASKVAVTAVEKYIKEKFITIPKEKEQILELIKNAIEFANIAIFEEAKQDEELHDMGTTIEVCLIYKNKIYIGHVGDSRIYRIRKNIMKKLTTDHSYVEKLVKDGEITREEAFNHPKKNLLIKALGTSGTVEPDVIYKALAKDDILVICSDGLTNMVREERILELIKENEDVAVDVLISEANAAGGLDNITVILIINK